MWRCYVSCDTSVLSDLPDITFIITLTKFPQPHFYPKIVLSLVPRIHFTGHHFQHRRKGTQFQFLVLSKGFDIIALKQRSVSTISLYKAICDTFECLTASNTDTFIVNILIQLDFTHTIKTYNFEPEKSARLLSILDRGGIM